MKVRTLSELGRTDLHNKKVFLRVDLNVPLDKDGNITDDSRIQAALPTIKYLIENKARLIIVSHLGRPKGQVVEELRLTPVAKRISDLLKRQVNKLNESVGTKVENEINRMQPGDICVLENIRFNPGEEKNDTELAKELAAFADIYVNDAFGTAHRAHASTVGVTSYLKPAVAGFLMAKELEMLGSKLENPERPFTAIIGGAKVSSKISVLKNLLDKVDTVIIGGAMAYTFIKAEGGSVGNSLCEDDYLETAREILNLANEKDVAFILPEDNICAQEIEKTADVKICSTKSIDAPWIGLDIGPAAIEKYQKLISQSMTIVWNGPMGMFEIDAFKKGTEAIATELAKKVKKGGTVIVGGGDSVAAIEKFGFPKTAFTHVSTGGGASLEFLEGKELPGVACLDKAEVSV